MSPWRHGARRLSVWFALALPGIWMLHSAWQPEVLAMDLLRPSGETAVRLMVLAMLPGPLAAFFGRRSLLQWWLSVRRYLGVAASAYALLHLALYVADMRRLDAMLAELELPGIWTGWLAMLALAVPALISSDSAMRVLQHNWKRLQRLVYVAAIAALVHWLLLDADWRSACIHAAPLLLAWGLRVWSRVSIGR